MLAVVFFFGVAGLFFGERAYTNDRGLILNGIELSQNGAAIFYWVLCAASAGFVAIGLSMLVTGLVRPHKLVLSGDGVSAPKRAWSRQPTYIRYADIASLAVTRVNGQIFLGIEHPGGKLSVVAAMLDSKALFDDFREELTEKVRAARAGVG